MLDGQRFFGGVGEMFNSGWLDFFDFGRNVQASGSDFLQFLLGRIQTHAQSEHLAVHKVGGDVCGLPLHAEVERDPLQVVDDVCPAQPVVVVIQLPVLFALGLLS